MESRRLLRQPWMGRSMSEANKIDFFERELQQFPEIECPVEHRFTPGMYCRTIYMPKDSIVTSKIHKTEHPFVISQGSVSVWTEEQGLISMSAPYMGITKPGTRRVLHVHEPTIWTTFHCNPDDTQDVDQIEQRIIEPHMNPLLASAPELIGGSL